MFACRRSSNLSFLTAVFAILFLASSADAQGYRRPPEEIAKILEAPPTPSVSIDPTATTMLLIDRASMPPISDLAQPMWRLAGSRLNPATNGRAGSRAFTGLSLKDMKSGVIRRIALPDDANVGSPSWSPDGSVFAFTITTASSIELWLGDKESGAARRLTDRALNGASGAPFSWMPDGKTLLVRFVPAKRGPRPVASRVPEGPVIQQTKQKVAPVRTYQDLLQNRFDESRYEWIMRSELSLVSVADGKATQVGGSAIWSGLSPSPDGKYILSTRTVRPYSYLVTARSFPRIMDVIDTRGKAVSRISVNGILDDIPIGGVPTGRRSIAWCRSKPATLVWAEALDGGDPKKEVAHRDKVMALDAPFKVKPRELLKTEHRYRGMTWLEAPGLALVGEFDRDRRWSRTWLFNMDDKTDKARLLWDRSTQDRYSDPGRPVSTIAMSRRGIVDVHEGSIYLSGRGSSQQGDRPFLDRLNIKTLETNRVWQCAAKTYESMVSLLEKDGSRIITSFETPSTPPNYVLHDFAGKTRHQLTDFKDPAPQLRSVKKRLVKYKRADGVDLSSTLYLPPGYDGKKRLPLIVWAYPREFNNAKNAGQITGSPYRFTSIRGTSHLFMLLQGYAIMDRATMPVVGEPETCNDTFIEQIVSSAKAAIDTADEMGIGDPKRVGVGGHSYGAFMTANLLAHCDLFKAGIARSGAYNRTLTPFGFQSERRTFWEAPEIYFKLSPFMHADKINEALLLIHGEADNNSGTFPIQSKRLFHALKGHGGNARLVMLPHESHGYRAKESVLHVVAEMVDWFNLHLKTVGD